MRAAAERILDWIEAPTHTPLGTLLFTLYAFAAVGVVFGVVALFAYVGGWYALAVMGGAVAVGVVYQAGVEHGRHV